MYAVYLVRRLAGDGVFLGKVDARTAHLFPHLIIRNGNSQLIFPRATFVRADRPASPGE